MSSWGHNNTWNWDILLSYSEGGDCNTKKSHHKTVNSTVLGHCLGNRGNSNSFGKHLVWFYRKDKHTCPETHTCNKKRQEKWMRTYEEWHSKNKTTHKAELEKSFWRISYDLTWAFNYNSAAENVLSTMGYTS